MNEPQFGDLVSWLQLNLPDNNLARHLEAINIIQHLDAKGLTEQIIHNIMLSPERARGIEYKENPECPVFDRGELTKNRNYNKDYRLRNIKLEYFRKFPEKEGDYPFGISFLDHAKNPSSAIILGANGAGKSSVYAAIEYLYRDKISELQLRNFGKKSSDKEERTRKFIRNWNHPYEQVMVQIETNAIAKKEEERITYDVFDQIERLALKDQTLREVLKSCYFISEQDVWEFGRVNYMEGDLDSFRMKIANAVDIGDIAWFHWLICEIATGEIRCWDKNLELYDASEEEKEQQKTSDYIHQGKLYILNQEFINSHEWSDVEMRLDRLSEINNTQIARLLKKIQYFSEIRQEEISNLDYDLLFTCKETIQSIKKEINEILAIIRREVSFIQTIYLYEEIYADLMVLQNYLSALRSHPVWNYITRNFRIDFPYTPSDQKNKTVRSLFLDLDSYMTEETPKVRFENIESGLKKNKVLIQNLFLNFKGNSPENILEEIMELNHSHIPQVESTRIRKEEKEENAIRKQINLCLIEEAREIYRVINEPLNQFFNEYLAEIKPIVSDVMEIFFKEEELIWDPEKLSIEEDKDGRWKFNKNYCTLWVRKKGSGHKPNPLSNKTEGVSPKKYFNTFRYKLFCTMLNIGVSFAMKKRNNVNFPLILDDVLYASDFQNKFSIRHFIQSILSSHHTIFGNELPLQLIVFTHDEMVFNSIKENNSELFNGSSGLKFYRLLDYTKAETKKELEINNLIYEY